MNVAEQFDSHRDRYYGWIFERQRIWYRRIVEKAPYPYTDDPILSNQRFTNAYRELDRGTAYSLQQVLIPSEGSKDRNFTSLFMRVLTYRLFNKVATYDKVFRPAGYFTNGELPDWEALKVALAELNESGPIFTNAHVIPTFGAVASKEERKSDKVIDFLKEFHASKYGTIDFIRTATFEEAHKKLMKIDNLGDFLAFEILSDLAYTDAVMFTEDDWANAGPGAREGLKLLYPDDERKPITLMRELQDQQNLMFASLGLPLYLYVPGGANSTRLTLRNIEGGLCEYFKYNGCVNQGKRRLPFRPGDGYAWKKVLDS